MGCCYGKEEDPPRYESEAELSRMQGEQGSLRTVRNMTSHYTVNYPEHDERKNSAIYNKTHLKMKTMPCFICGKTNETDGIHVETHHFYCAKAFQNAFDWKKFGEYAQNCYNMHTGQCIGTQFDWDEVAKNPDLFVDSPYNMIVLCKQHHTSGRRGIHHVPFPEWLAQKFAKDGFEVLCDAY